MNQLRNALSVFFLAAVALAFLLIVVVAFNFLSVPLLLMLALFYGWVFHAFLHYRLGRQEEFLHLLAAAAESGAPLAPVVRAYLRDRPPGRWVWAAVLLFFVAPGYYWLWHRRRAYDRKLARVARELEQGTPLYVALRSEPGVVSRSTALAVAVGESTGHLAVSLRRSSRGGTSVPVVWLEALPRLLYPVALLMFLSSILAFWSVYLLPKMERIFHDFGIAMPEMTAELQATGRWAMENNWLVVLAFHGLLGLAVLALVNSTLRWYTPGLGQLYRMDVRSRVLKMLGVLLEAGKPLPEALGILAGSGAFPVVVAARLGAVRSKVEQGEPLAESLVAGGLLPARMAPLVRAAQRAQNLPWALAELGEHLAARAVRLTRWLSLALFQVAVVAVGVVVGFMVIGMFMPLVKLITEMA